MTNPCRKILLVDDSKTFQSLFKAALGGSDCELFVCNDGQHALDLIGTQYIDFICSSFYLPDMEGIDLCRRVRSLTHYASKPFVLLTSVDHAAELTKALPAGVTDVFHRNDVEQLLAFIKRFPSSNERIEGRVLYVEDNKSQRTALQAILEQRGLQVDAFASADDAWLRFQNHDYDLVLTDIVLDGSMSGLAFVNHIRRQTTEKGDTPIIVLTAFDDKTRRIELFNLGVTDYIPKPVAEDEMFVRISGLLKMRGLARELELERRQRHTDELRLSDARLQAVLDASPDAVLISDEQGVITQANPQVQPLLGYAAAELIGRPIDSLVPESLRGNHAAQRAGYSASPVSRRMGQGRTVKARRKDGTDVDIEISLSRMRTERGFLFVSALRDITERRRIELDMRESEVTFRKLFEDSSDAILLIDGTGVFVECNKAALELLRMTREQFLLLPPARISPEFQPGGGRSDQLAPEMIAQAYRKGQHRFDWTCINAEGGEFIVEVSLMPIVIRGQNMLHTTWRDITARKQAEAEIASLHADLEKRVAERTAELLRAEHLSDQALQLAHAGHWSIDFTEGDEYYISSPRTIEIFGDPPRDKLRYHLMSDWHVNIEAADKAAAATTLAKFRAAVEGRTPRFDSLHPYRRPSDGTIVWVHVLGQVVRDRNGRATHVYGVVMDVTAMKQAEDELRLAKDAAEASERFMHVVTDAIPGQIAYVTADMHFEFANKAYREWFGKSAEDMRGIHLRDLLGEELFQKSRSFFDAALRGETLSFLRTRTDAEGKPVYLWANYVPDIHDGQVRGVFGLFSDITELKNAQLELEQVNEQLKVRTVQAEAANVAKSDFLANMSHELRTPLSAVIGMAGLARSITTDPRLRDYLDKISISGKHLNRVINDLLDLSKISAGYMEFEHVTFSLNGLLARCKSVMAYSIAEHGLSLLVTVDAEVPDVLRGDPLRIEQIILNLVGNAIKFTPTGHIEVRVGVHERKAEKVWLNVEVEDTGIGMGPEVLERLFKPFSQGNETVSRQFGGTGLGLAISKRLASMMDGDISVTSREGSGSTFLVRICLGLGDASELLAVTANAQTSMQMCYENARVLVVDDQPLNREIAEGLLSAVGIAVHLAANGKEALEIISSGRDAFDLVLMDIQMPVMDGLAATRAIRGLEGFAGLPIVAMTAQTMAHEIARSTAAGMNDHIGKPFDDAGFYRVLTKWISPDKQHLQTSVAIRPASPAGLPFMRGVDTDAGLALFLGNEARYRHWLGEFVVAAPAAAKQIHTALSADQPEAASVAAHVLKGRMGLLGMHELHAIAAALETALDKAEPTDLMLLRLEQDINVMCAEIRSGLGLAESPITTIDVPEFLAENLPPGVPPASVTQLIASLQAGEGDCDRLATACLAELEHTAWAPRLRRALIHIQEFDFGAAARLLGSNGET